MMATTDDPRRRLERLKRLSKLGVKRAARDLARPPAPAPAPVSQPGSSVSPLPGEPVITPYGPAWMRTVRFLLADRPDLAAWLDVGGEMLAALGRDPSLARLDPRRAAFIDTETTGLSVGAGTYTFLIGVGVYEEEAFLVHQIFMRNPGEERAQLHLVEETVRNCTGIVSFNGRAFDLPLIQNRFILARMPLPLAGVPHLDLLPAARRVWSARLPSCSLGSLEHHVLGVQRTEEDVPGWLIPQIYRDYYRAGAATDMLARVFYHNLLDITSMVLLGARAASYFRQSQLDERFAGLHPLECVSLGRCYQALEWAEAGVAAYRAALKGSPIYAFSEVERAGTLHELGLLLKRLDRQEEAAALWEEWISTIPGDDLIPYIELAKYHEWHTTDLAAARGWTAWALRIAGSLSVSAERDDALADLQHRLERLERKLAGAAKGEIDSAR